MTLAGHLPALQKLFPRALFEAFNPSDKTNLAPYRYLHLMLLVALGARFIPIDSPGLHAVTWRPLIKCGQQSLEVFCVGIYLAFIAYFILQMTSDGILAQFLVGIACISIMTAVAYYESWSKRAEKSDYGLRSRHSEPCAEHRGNSEARQRYCGPSLIRRARQGVRANVNEQLVMLASM